ncbi:MAG: helix-turn-helix transcriptional regulator, partial [Peptococcaceae bacterium]|nr:helix-turn-helix transcriptional regulator [Peptococcaceae bacterium]
MHLLQIVRSYLGVTQQELAQKAGILQPDLCEMEIKPPYGWIEKYQKLSEYLGIPIHALVTNDCTLVPLSFFDKHPRAAYMENATGGAVGLGRKGEEAAFQHELEKLRDIYPALAKLVLP